MTESELIKGCKRGRRKYQKALYEMYAPVFLGVIYRYFPDYHRANDILQDSFVKIFSNLRQYGNKGSFEGWMKRICINTALSELRRKSPITFGEFEESFSQNLSETPGDEADIVQLVATLPQGYREVFNLHGIEGYSFKEIGVMLAITEGNARVQYHRARKKMQELLNKYFIEVP